MVAVIPWNMLDDFVKGEENMRDFPCQFNSRIWRECAPGSIAKPRKGSVIITKRYTCSYGSDDNRGKVAEELHILFASALQLRKTGQTNSEKSNVKGAKKGQKRKAPGKGEVQAPTVVPNPPKDTAARAKTEPHKKLTKTHAGLSQKRGCQCNFVAKQIMAEHKRQVMLMATNNEKPMRDTFIMMFDVQNLAKKQTEELWRKDLDNATSVTM